MSVHVCVHVCVHNYVSTLPFPCLQVHSISQWVAAQIPTLPHRGYEEAYKVWYGKNMMSELETRMGITAATYNIYRVRSCVVLLMLALVLLTVKWR